MQRTGKGWWVALSHISEHFYNERMVTLGLCMVKLLTATPWTENQAIQFGQISQLHKYKSLNLPFGSSDLPWLFRF